jgi:hypothetical protein
MDTKSYINYILNSNSVSPNKNINYILGGSYTKFKDDRNSQINFILGNKPRPVPGPSLRRIPQKQFLRENRYNLKQQITDHDGDGVISGIDCYPYDYDKHGWLQKSINFLKGKGYTDYPLSQEAKVQVAEHNRIVEQNEQRSEEKKAQEYIKNQLEQEKLEYPNNLGDQDFTEEDEIKPEVINDDAVTAGKEYVEETQTQQFNPDDVMPVELDTSKADFVYKGRGFNAINKNMPRSYSPRKEKEIETGTGNLQLIVEDQGLVNNKETDPVNNPNYSFKMESEPVQEQSELKQSTYKKPSASVLAKAKNTNFIKNLGTNISEDAKEAVDKFKERFTYKTGGIFSDRETKEKVTALRETEKLFGKAKADGTDPQTIINLLEQKRGSKQNQLAQQAVEAEFVKKVDIIKEKQKKELMKEKLNEAKSYYSETEWVLNRDKVKDIIKRDINKLVDSEIETDPDYLVTKSERDSNLDRLTSAETTLTDNQFKERLKTVEKLSLAKKKEADLRLEDVKQREMYSKVQQQLSRATLPYQQLMELTNQRALARARPSRMNAFTSMGGVFSGGDVFSISRGSGGLFRGRDLFSESRFVNQQSGAPGPLDFLGKSMPQYAPVPIPVESSFNSQPFNQGISNISNQDTFTMKPLGMGMFPESNLPSPGLPKPIRKTPLYDVNAPKFVYKRNVDSFTRKTDRVVKGDDLEIGKPSMPSKKKSKNSLYPWTKPMQGWERIYVGSGRTVSKGRRKKGGRTWVQSEGYVKPMKRGFSPYAKTYPLKL